MGHTDAFRAIVRTAALTHWRHHCTRRPAPANDAPAQSHLIVSDHAVEVSHV